MPIANEQQKSTVPRIVVVMGVSGCGKSTVGIALANRLGKPFLDADDYHPAANVEKMSRGIELTDEDRWPWLDRFGAALKRQADRAGMAIGACSALRRSYRERLQAAAGAPLRFVFLSGTRDLIAARIAARTDHFMPAALLASQFATLEPPQSDEGALTVDVGPSVAELAVQIEALLERGRQTPAFDRNTNDEESK